MPVRRFFAVGLWLCVTASATAIVWAGTSSVASNLTDRPAPVVAHRDVVSALQSGSSEVETTPGISSTSAGNSPTTLPPDGGGSAVADPDAPVASGPEASDTVVATTIAPASPPAVPPVVGPSPPTTLAPSPSTAAYSTPGGVVTVSCRGFGNYFIELVSAAPSNGYAVNVVSAGPYYVEVHFVRPGRDEPLWAYCFGQPIRAYGGAPGPREAPGPG